MIGCSTPLTHIFFHAEMDLVKPHCTPGLRAYQTMMEKIRTSRLLNQKRLRELKRAQAGLVTLCCAHDVREFEQLSGRSHLLPIAAERFGQQPPVDAARPSARM